MKPPRHEEKDDEQGEGMEHPTRKTTEKPHAIPKCEVLRGPHAVLSDGGTG